jgi:hypothetical protein
MSKRQMNVHYDTEFHEDGKTIDLISIGMVRADGKEFYAVSNEFDTVRVANHEWLMKNVMNSIDHVWVPGGVYDTANLTITDPAAMSRADIAAGITEFVSDIDPRWWAWFGAYDHMALCQLFGKMIDLPNGWPMWTNDLRQMYEDWPARWPAQMGGNHNALDDAKHNVVKYQAMIDLKNWSANK